MFKKSVKIIGISLLVLLGLLFAIPYFFEDQIKAKILDAINQKLDAKVSFSEANLSLFKNFPNASVSLENISVINKAPFAGDTLFATQKLQLKMAITELFKGDKDPIAIESFASENGIINILFDINGKGNFDIALKEERKNESESGKPLQFKIHDYKIVNYRFRYSDASSKIKMQLDSINHQGNGNFETNNLDLITQTTAKISLDKDKTNYMKKVPLSLEAVLGIDLANSKYSFKKNKALINQLPLELDGFLQMQDKGQLYDLSFKTPTASFTNFLGLLPAAYLAKTNDVTTTGDFTVVGFAKGMYNDTTIPKFSIQIASNNASFHYKDLPKTVKNIIIDTKISNQTGILNDTYVNIDKLSFQIDQDVFSAAAHIKNVTTNPLVDAALKGTINLSNVTKAYPIKLDKPLTGILNADVTTNFDMQSVEKSNYANIKNAGTMQLRGFDYVDENGKKLNISNAQVQFNPSVINLLALQAKTGKSDISATGVLENFYGFLFNKQELKGNFTMRSTLLSVNDFVTTSPAKTTENKVQKTEAMKIPAFLNCSVTASAATVLYDNLVLKNVSGKLLIKDQKATLVNGKTNIFGGSIGFNGSVSTKAKVPVFDMKLGLNQVDIAQSFTQLEMLKKIAPIAGIINGKLNSTIKLHGNLDAKEFTPDLKSLTGDLLGQLLSSTINSKNATLLNALGAQIKFIDFTKINLNDIKAAITFDKGKVNIQPFAIKYQDIKATVGGTHGFDQLMNYSVKLDVPAKYLGTQANALFAKLTPADAAKLENIPINALLSGNFSQPKVTTDIKAALSNLTNQLVQQQKAQLVKKGSTAISDILTKNQKKSDTTAAAKTNKENVKAKAADLLNGLFNKKKKPAEAKPAE